LDSVVIQLYAGGYTPSVNRVKQLENKSLDKVSANGKSGSVKLKS